MFCGDLNGKEIQKRGEMCLQMADSLRCTIETNNTAQQLYFNNFFLNWQYLVFRAWPFREGQMSFLTAPGNYRSGHLTSTSFSPPAQILYSPHPHHKSSDCWVSLYLRQKRKVYKQHISEIHLSFYKNMSGKVKFWILEVEITIRVKFLSFSLTHTADWMVVLYIRKNSEKSTYCRKNPACHN